jgi:hypothetical protein
MIFKTYSDLNDYLNEVDMINLEMLAAAIVEEPPEEIEEDGFCRYDDDE